MVSQLSARLLADRSDSGSSNDSDRERASSGGYSADREGTSSPPGHISLQGMKHKRHIVSDGNERNKRQKLNEEQYAASVAKETVKKAGRKVRPIDTNRSRICLGKVDMSRVQLVRSKDIESSPFLIPSSQPLTEIKYDYSTESVYNALLDSCRVAYELLDAVDMDSTDSASTSSFSDTESDDSQGSNKERVVLTPRVDDSAPVVTQHFISTVMEPEVSTPPAVSMTMEEALTVCNISRYVFICISD